MKKLFFFVLTCCLGQTSMLQAADTDISSITNVIYIESFAAKPGSSELDLSVKMKNTAAIRGFQFDLTLPEGVTPATYSNGNIKCTLSAGRLPEGDQHTISVSRQDNGSYRFLCGSLADETFTGTDGEVAVLKINIASTMAEGEYPIVLTSIKMTETDISNYYETERVESTLTISNSIRTILDETSTSVPTAASGVDVRVKRTIYANEWSTLCLPFAMTEAQVKAAFGDDVQLADFAGTDTEFDDLDNVIGITANFNDVTAIEANHPYIIKVSSAVSSFDVDGVDIEPDEDEAYIEFDNGKSGSRRVVLSGFYGSLRAGTVLEENTLFLSENKFWYSAGLTTMKAFRAYFDFLDVLTEVEEAGARIVMNFDVETTDIGAINNGEWMMDDVYYDLQGRPVKTPTKGVYIKNGKKVIVK